MSESASFRRNKKKEVDEKSINRVSQSVTEQGRCRVIEEAGAEKKKKSFYVLKKKLEWLAGI